MAKHRLRSMIESDLGLVLQWRNHQDVRRYMYTTHEIQFDEHRKWFSEASVDSTINLFIYEQDGKSQGFLNISRTRCPEVADWGFYLAPSAPQGSGRELGRQALRHAFSQMGLHKVCGKALGFNERSIAFHKALGFSEEGILREQHFDGNQFHDVVCFGLLSSEWQAKAKD